MNPVRGFLTVQVPTFSVAMPLVDDLNFQLEIGAANNLSA